MSVTNEKMVEILMATYCGERYIREQIDSILCQTYTNWKLVIRDDGSKDNTYQIIQEYCDKYPQKIVLIPSEKPSGCAKNNFMYLLELAISEYIMFCDQDDVWDENKIEVSLEKLVEIECKEKVPALVHSDLRVVDEKLQIIEASFEKYMSMDYTRNTVNHLLIENVVVGCTMIINRTLQEHAIRNYNTENMTMHDQWLALLASSIGRLAVLPQATMNYRQHQGNAVGTQNVVSIKNFKSALKKSAEIHKSLERSMKQAEMLMDTVGHLMPLETQMVIKQYAQLRYKHKIGRMVGIQRNHFYAKSYVKQCAILVFV